MSASRRSPSTTRDPKLFREGDNHIITHSSQLPFQTSGYLGAGASGTVEKVTNSDGTEYARKILSFHPTKSKREKERIFRRELDIIKSLGKHHHMVKVFATYITFSEFALLLSPVADGGDLKKFLAVYWNEQHEYWSTQIVTKRWERMRQDLQRFFGCLASGLAFMHNCDIRHRDISPNNILVHQGLVIYTDFGYSLDHSGLSADSHSTGKPEAYTPKYAAPEVRNWDRRGPKADVYSLGCVFVDLLSAYMGRETLALPEVGFEDEEAIRFEHIRQAMLELEISKSCLILAELIINMTQLLDEGRPEAEEVFNVIVNSTGYYCSRCQDPTSEAITSSEQVSDQSRQLMGDERQDLYHDGMRPLQLHIGSKLTQKRSKFSPLVELRERRATSCRYRNKRSGTHRTAW